MKKEVRILVGLLALVGVGLGLAAYMYGKSASSEATSGLKPGQTGGVAGVMTFRDELIRPDSHALGPENAALTVVEFLDPECESCKAFHPTIKRWLEENQGKVRFVVRYMPFHSSSRMAVAALESAALQGKYWEMLDLLFAMADEWGHQPEPRADLFEKYAGSLGLDVAKFTTDLADPRWATLAERDMADGQAMGVRGTPTVFFNGEVLRDLSLEGLRAQGTAMLGASAP
jgi:protein-disulfide isomerase